MNKIYSLGRIWQGELIDPHFSSYSIVQFFDKIVDDLCTHKPKNRKQYTEFLKTRPKKHFRYKSKMSIYLLGNRRFNYRYSFPN